MSQKIILILFATVLLALAATGFLLWRFDPEVYYYVPPEKSFLYTKEELNYGIERYLREAVETKRTELIAEKKSFVDVNLQNMELTLYKEGEKFKVFPVQSKGEEWFWGKTPPGVYYAGFRTRLHFSSAARVWMPYAVQYYGNYFLHGWPYDRAGRELPPGPSGGCIRLRTKDAAQVLEFTEPGMPILILDEILAPPLPALTQTEKEVVPPELTGQSFLVADLDTGEIILSKEADSQVYAGSATQGMLALVASDAVNLEKAIVARDWMIQGIEKENIVLMGKSYKGQDLLKPLLSFSSKEAALLVSRFLTAEKFVALMNDKAKGIGMKDTSFIDVTGASQENITTLYDAAKMMRYIKDYRKFILDVSRQLGGNDQASESLFAALEMTSAQGTARTIFVGVARSPAASKDLENIVSWIATHFDLSK